MKGSLALRKPVGTPAFLDTSSTNVTTGAYVQLVASTAKACSAIGIHNPGASPLKLAVGAGGSEVDTGLVIPINQWIMVPIEIAASKRISLKSLSGTQSSGVITICFFQ